MKQSDHPTVERTGVIKKQDNLTGCPPSISKRLCHIFSYQNFQKYGPEMDYQQLNRLWSIFTAIEQNSLVES